jgi:glycosyltransferase involved in cell wall biosynthesis
VIFFPSKPTHPGVTLLFSVGFRRRKDPDRAIEIAVKAGVPMKIAAKIDRVDQAYWDEKIRAMVEVHSNVEYIGEINEHEKAAFLGDASALLFPVDWPEPFGLVMIEAMACGTPVVAFRRGSVPEIIEDGTSGFIVDTIEQAVFAVQRISSLDRAKVRATFERRFTVERMAQDYAEIYQTLTETRVEAGRSIRLKSKFMPPATRKLASDFAHAGAENNARRDSMRT